MKLYKKSSSTAARFQMGRYYYAIKCQSLPDLIKFSEKNYNTELLKFVIRKFFQIKFLMLANELT